MSSRRNFLKVLTGTAAAAAAGGSTLAAMAHERGVPILQTAVEPDLDSMSQEELAALQERIQARLEQQRESTTPGVLHHSDGSVITTHPVRMDETSDLEVSHQIDLNIDADMAQALVDGKDVDRILAHVYQDYTLRLNRTPGGLDFVVKRAPAKVAVGPRTLSSSVGRRPRS